ncbi:unnamed protein product, partial [Ixodes persulcatus]
PFYHCPLENFPAMYAYVRFQDDGKKLVGAVLDVKNFKPAHKKDFNGRSWYDIWWQGMLSRASCAYMRYQNCKKLQLCALRYFVGRPEKGKGNCQEKNRQKTYCEPISSKQQQMQRRFKDEDEPTDPLQVAQSEIRQLKKELKEVREQNATLQAALCSKVFHKASISTALISLPSERDQEQGSTRPPGNCSTPRSVSLALLDAEPQVPLAPEVSGSDVRAASEVQCPAPSLRRLAPRVAPRVAPSVPLDIEELPLPARVPSPDNPFQAV